MTFFKTRVWCVGYDADLSEEETLWDDNGTNCLTNDKYHYIFQLMSDKSYNDFKKNVEYQMNKDEFLSITNINYKQKNQLTPFYVEDFLLFIHNDAPFGEPYLIKSVFNKDGPAFLECTWYTSISSLNKDDIFYGLDGMADGWCGGSCNYLFYFDKYKFIEKFKNMKKNFPSELMTLIAEYYYDHELQFDVSARYQISHSEQGKFDKCISFMDCEHNYENIMKSKFI